jgi:hypothetical protein
MKNRNIHTLDESQLETLLEIVTSQDNDAVNVAVEIMKNLDLNDEETIKQLTKLASTNIIDKKDMDADAMKVLLASIIELQNRGLNIDRPPVVIEKKDDSEIVTQLSVCDSAIIEDRFVKRKHLAEQWLKDETTEDEKYEIEKQIHALNKEVADLLGIEYNDKDEEN